MQQPFDLLPSCSETVTEIVFDSDEEFRAVISRIMDLTQTFLIYTFDCKSWQISPESKTIQFKDGFEHDPSWHDETLAFRLSPEFLCITKRNRAGRPATNVGILPDFLNRSFSLHIPELNIHEFGYTISHDTIDKIQDCQVLLCGTSLKTEIPEFDTIFRYQPWKLDLEYVIWDGYALYRNPHQPKKQNFVALNDEPNHYVEFATFSKFISFLKMYYHSNGHYAYISTWMACHNQLEFVREPAVVLNLKIKTYNEFLHCINSLYENSFVLYCIIEPTNGKTKPGQRRIQYSPEKFKENQDYISNLLYAFFHETPTPPHLVSLNEFPREDVLFEISHGEYNQFGDYIEDSTLPIIKGTKVLEFPVGIFLDEFDLEPQKANKAYRSTQMLLTLLGDSVIPYFTTQDAKTKFESSFPGGSNP